LWAGARPVHPIRDILQCRSSLSANGGIAEVEGWVGPAASVANDPKATLTSDEALSRATRFSSCPMLTGIREM